MHPIVVVLFYYNRKLWRCARHYSGLTVSVCLLADTVNQLHPERPCTAVGRPTIRLAFVDMSIS